MGRQFSNEIKSLREAGMTYDAISRRLGISRQNVWYTAKEMGLTNNSYQRNRIIYKGVKDWLTKHKMPFHDFCIKCGEQYGANSRTYNLLIGKYKGDVKTIGNVLNACGLTFDEAFGEVINETKEED